jgi:hypothetical protein
MGTRTPGIALTILGAGLLVVSGWLGWTLVQTWHVGVLEEHERNRPSSDEPGKLPAETTMPPMPAGRRD